MYNSDFESLQEYDQLDQDRISKNESDSKSADDKQYCDECGDSIILHVWNKEIVTGYVVGKLKINIASANKGESAIFCADCYKRYEVMASEVDE